MRARLAAVRRNLLRSDAPTPASRNCQLRMAGVLEVGAHTYGEPIILVWANAGRVEIGSYCSIAADVEIYTGGDHRTDWVTTYPLRIKFGLPGAGRDGHPSTKGDVIIGSDVWIANHARIHSGVNIGHGAVIGEGAVVLADVPPYGIVGGNPARLVRFRFSESQIARLLDVRWWDWPDDEVIAAADRLCAPDIDGFLQWAQAAADGNSP